MEEKYREAIGIARMLARYLGKNTDEEEKRRIEHWKNIDPRNDKLFDQLLSPERRHAREREKARVNLDKEWMIFRASINSSRGRYRRLVKWSIAAAIVIIIVQVVYLRYGVYPVSEPVVPEAIADLMPASGHITLRLSSGKEVQLDNSDATIRHEQGVDIVNGNGQLTYQGDSTAATTKAYNELDIPRGVTFKLALDDGTMVWLNSMTRIKYPVTFDRHERRVELFGEAYFEVQPDASRPFIVQTREYQINVLGTRFNVNCYEDQKITHATLVSGLLQVIDSVSAPCTITPGQQYLFNKERGEHLVEHVDTGIYTSWMEGFFRFESEPLREIFKRVQRKYPVNVIFTDEAAAAEIFTGKLPFYDKLDVILEQLGKVSNVKFECHDNNIYVSSNPK